MKELLCYCGHKQNEHENEDGKSTRCTLCPFDWDFDGEGKISKCQKFSPSPFQPLT